MPVVWLNSISEPKEPGVPLNLSILGIRSGKVLLKIAVLERDRFSVGTALKVQYI
jgi:hypothetical protein